MPLEPDTELLAAHGMPLEPGVPRCHPGKLYGHTQPRKWLNLSSFRTRHLGSLLS